jgi:hypothetical protein
MTIAVAGILGAVIAASTWWIVRVRTRAPAVNGAHGRYSVEVDWSHANGSNLSADVIVSPEATQGNPLAGRDWVRVAYVGVPPGRNARLLVAVRTAGVERTLYTDGWPDTNRHGRRIGRQRIEIRTGGARLEVLENGERVLEADIEVHHR